VPKPVGRASDVPGNVEMHIQGKAIATRRDVKGRIVTIVAG